MLYSMLLQGSQVPNTGRGLRVLSLALALGLPVSLSASSAQTVAKITDRVDVAQAKPSIKPPPPAKPAAQLPGPVAETSQAQPQPAAAGAAAPEQSALGGSWKINWLRQNKATSLNITSERPQPGIVGFDGVLTSLAGTECKGGGFAAKTLGGVFPTGGDVNMVGVADYVRIVTQCAQGQVWLEALGVAGKPLQWVGRAVMIDAAGARSFESFVLTR